MCCSGNDKVSLKFCVKFCCFNSLSVSDFVCFNSLLTISSKVWHSNFWRFFVAQLNAGTWKLRRSSWCLIGNRFAWNLLQRCPAITCVFGFCEVMEGYKNRRWHWMIFLASKLTYQLLFSCQFPTNCNRSLQELQVKLLVVLLALFLLMRFQKKIQGMMSRPTTRKGTTSWRPELDTLHRRKNWWNRWSVEHTRRGVYHSDSQKVRIVSRFHHQRNSRIKSHQEH